MKPGSSPSPQSGPALGTALPGARPTLGLLLCINIFFIHALGDVISPIIIGILSDRYNMNVAFLLAALMFLISGILWLIGARSLERDTRLAATPLAARSRRPAPSAEKE